jgi:hypothetical protein
MMNVLSINPKFLPAIIVGAGVAVSALAAVIPHFSSAYRLLPMPLMTGITLYVVYGMLAALWHTEMVRRVGVIVLSAHVAAVLFLRMLDTGPIGQGLLALTPVLLAVGVLGLWPQALRASDPVSRASSAGKSH